MKLDTGSLLDRFHRVLVDEIRRRRPELLDASFTVAEIYQELVPYRSHRDRIGVEMNGDYEQLLLMLLAGRGNYLRLESEAALKELQAELSSSNPNPRIFRDYAAADVRLNPDRVDPGSAVSVESLAPSLHVVQGSAPEALEGREPDEPREPVYGGDPAGPEPGEDDRPEDGEKFLMDVAVVESGVRDGDASASDTVVPDHPPDPSPDAAPDLSRDAAPDLSPKEEVASGEHACPSCAAGLPERDVVHFCPFCGHDLRLPACEACGDPLEPGWSFCASCGTSVVTD